MSKINGTFEKDTQENYSDVLGKLGVPEDLAKVKAQGKQRITVKVEGKKILWKYDDAQEWQLSVIDGEEVEEPREFLGEIWLSKAHVEGNVVKISSKIKNGKIQMQRAYTFSDAGLQAVVTVQDATAKLFFKRI